MTRTSICAAALLLASCSGDFLDDIEDEAYDAAATKLSDYCALNRGDLFWQRTRIEVRREIRQRGDNGPPGPVEVPEGLDQKTAFGPGPVLMIWCGGETTGQSIPYAPPETVWRAMIRDWRD